MSGEYGYEDEDVDEMADSFAAALLDDEAEEVDDDLITEPSTEDEGEGESIGNESDVVSDEQAEDDDEENSLDDFVVDDDAPIKHYNDSPSSVISAELDESMSVTIDVRRPQESLSGEELVEYNDWIECALRKEAEGNLCEAIECLINVLEACDDNVELHRKLWALSREAGVF